MNPVFSALIGGILPFGAVFIEPSFILTSMWLHTFDHIFGFLALVALILVGALLCSSLPYRNFADICLCLTATAAACSSVSNHMCVSCNLASSVWRCTCMPLTPLTLPGFHAWSGTDDTCPHRMIKELHEYNVYSASTP